MTTGEKVGGLAADGKIVHYWGKAPGGGGGYAGCGTMPISSGVKLELSIITPTPIRAAFYKGRKYSAESAQNKGKRTNLEVINLAAAELKRLERRTWH